MGGLRTLRPPLVAGVVALLLCAALAPSAAGATASGPEVSLAGPVTAQIFANPMNRGYFTATTESTVLFDQAFDVVDFNPDPGAVSCSNVTGVDQSTRPFTDVTPQADGSCTTQPVEGGGYQAGLGDLESFDLAASGSIAVSAAGVVEFSFSSDDGWVFGAGPDASGGQPEYVSGSLVNAPEATPFNGYQVVGAFNRGTGPLEQTVQVSIPEAGTYPIEIDYAECCTGRLTLTFLAGGSLVTQGGADLSVSQAASESSVTGGSDVTYTITAANAGPHDASGVTLADTLPAGATLVSATPSQGSCSGGGPVVCDLGSLASGGSATIAVVVETPCESATVTNTAAVSGDQPDPNPANDSATADVALVTPCQGASGEVENGGTVSTDPNHQGPQPDLGVWETSGVTVPQGTSGVVTIDLSAPPPPPDGCPDFTTLIATTDQPAAGHGTWLTLEFTYAACAIPPGTKIHHTTILWDGDEDSSGFEPLPNCRGNHDRPDPCVRKKKKLACGDFRYTVLWSGTDDPSWRPG